MGDPWKSISPEGVRAFSYGAYSVILVWLWSGGSLLFINNFLISLGASELLAKSVLPIENFNPTDQRIYSKLKRNGQQNFEIMQDSRTSNMTHDVYELVSYLSQDTTLKPYTLIYSATPGKFNYFSIQKFSTNVNK